jgi:type II secretory pathway component PulF
MLKIKILPRTTSALPRTTSALPRTTSALPRTTSVLPRTTSALPKAFYEFFIKIIFIFMLFKHNKYKFQINRLFHA